MQYRWNLEGETRSATTFNFFNDPFYWSEDYWMTLILFILEVKKTIREKQISNCFYRSSVVKLAKNKLWTHV